MLVATLRLVRPRVSACQRGRTCGWARACTTDANACTGCGAPEAACECDTTEAGEIQANEFQKAIEAGNARVLDVRGSDEYERGSVLGSCHVPYTRLAKHIDKLPPVNDEPLLVHCQGGLRSAMALTYLKRLGYNAVNIAGGYAAWARLGHQQKA